MCSSCIETRTLEIGELNFNSIQAIRNLYQDRPQNKYSRFKNMVLNTLLHFLYLDGGDPKNTPHGYYTFKNAKDTSEDCILFTNRVVRFLKNNRGLIKPGSRFSRVIQRLERDDESNPLSLYHDSERNLDLIAAKQAIDFRILNRSDIILTWILEFWYARFNILEYLYTILTYPQEIFTRSHIEEAIFNAENKLNIQGKLERHWKELTQYLS